MQLFVAKNGQQLGPFDEAQVRGMLASGTVSGEDLAWHSALPNWLPLSTVLGGPTPGVAPAPPPPVQAAAAPVFNPMGGGPVLPPPGGMAAAGYGSPALVPGVVAGDELATLGARFIGALVDGIVAIILAVPGMVLVSTQAVAAASANPNNPAAIETAAKSGFGFLLVILGSAIFYAIQGFLLARSGQTVGKMAAGTRVVMADGSRADVVHAFVLRLLLPGLCLGYCRYVPLIGGLLGFLAFVYVVVDICFIFRADRRCVHDLIAGTKVVRAR